MLKKERETGKKWEGKCREGVTYRYLRQVTRETAGSISIFDVAVFHGRQKVRKECGQRGRVGEKIRK